MSDAQVPKDAVSIPGDRTSKTLSIPDGELWSLVRSLISQGTYIQMDASAGKYQTSEEVFMRIDEAAREKADEIEAKYSAVEPSVRHENLEDAQHENLEIGSDAPMLSEYDQRPFDGLRITLETYDGPTRHCSATTLPPREIENPEREAGMSVAQLVSHWAVQLLKGLPLTRCEGRS